ncbi:hypothetical protein PPTG_21413 [Phytophthora nicotianae INRA-310]|uniref:Uncharacterized protein n=1 Tax=Phytophthora nicotianae (strain INRA-310) TaxID=761204 RepID=W2R187_PHYN3|nr:hypothetical protein PPTG_21413 [Phytophthora nicotianae INRA-310]ETN19113.1 hypothetical protein PPTG_21413 [Phytophthora nicotianae INRA-310]
MAPSAHVFVFDMGEGTTRFFMNRADPSTFEEAFTLELRKDNAGREYVVKVFRTPIHPITDLQLLLRVISVVEVARALLRFSHGIGEGWTLAARGIA